MLWAVRAYNLNLLMNLFALKIRLDTITMKAYLLTYLAALFCYNFPSQIWIQGQFKTNYWFATFSSIQNILTISTKASD